jgi:hypothetical protein
VPLEICITLPVHLEIRKLWKLFQTRKSSLWLSWLAQHSRRDEREEHSSWIGKNLWPSLTLY